MIRNTIGAVFGLALVGGVSTCSAIDYKDDGELDVVNVLRQTSLVLVFAVEKAGEAAACAYYQAVEESRKDNNPCHAVTSGRAFERLREDLEAISMHRHP